MMGRWESRKGSTAGAFGPTRATRPRILLVAGYFDDFGGYQEVSLAKALAKHADVEVIAGDRVSPAFTEAHLLGLGIPRRYPPGTTSLGNVRVTRFRSHEVRAMLWSSKIKRYISEARCDLVIQAMPGQLMPLAATLARKENRAPRVVLYADNQAMWSHLPPISRMAKRIIFRVTKGLLYQYVNSHADAIFGCTPDTLQRLSKLSSGHTMQLLPLSYDETVFTYDEASRTAFRDEFGIGPQDVVVIFAGKPLPQKRVDVLLEAVCDVGRIDRRLHLFVVGADSGAASLELRERAAGLPDGLRQRVHILPFSSATRLNLAFNGADIGVWPAMPAITIQQAMGTGLSVVVPDNRLVAHLVGESSGHLLNPTEELKGAIADTLFRCLAQQPVPPATRSAVAIDNSWLSSTSVARSLLQAGLPELSLPPAPCDGSAQ